MQLVLICMPMEQIRPRRYQLSMVIYQQQLLSRLTIIQYLLTVLQLLEESMLPVLLLQS